MIKIALCDNDNQQLLQIKTYVDDFISENLKEYDISVQSFENGADFLAKIDKGEYFDILLLDIIMPLVNGMPITNRIDYGLGPKSIVSVTQKYEGVSSFTASDKIFTMNVII